MGLNNLVDKLNKELDKINKESNSIDTNSFFTNDNNFNDDFSFEDNNNEFYNEEFKGKFELDLDKYKNIAPDDDTKDLVSVKERRLITAQNMFKKSIRVSLKAFLISLSLSFLNLFI